MVLHVARTIMTGSTYNILFGMHVEDIILIDINADGRIHFDNLARIPSLPPARSPSLRLRL
jgi:hypothetical protein